ncbi:MAG: GTPase [Acidimicrobiales bacterium]
MTGGSALAAPYAFATTDPNIGVAKVFDERLEALAGVSGSKKLVHATVQFNDIGGLVAGASQGEGLGNKFLSGIREVDAIVFVLRAFRDDDVPDRPIRWSTWPSSRPSYPRRPRHRRASDREEAQGGQGRQVAPA